MARKKNIKFKMDPEWLFKGPIDFEYNKYTLLGYLKKCEKSFDAFKIYPDFVELSLHLANLQSLVKEKTMLLTNKKFESCDDEILMKELFPKKPPKLSSEEQEEINKTIVFSNPKLLDAFNFAKSIWSIAFDNVVVSLKKNKEYLMTGVGILAYHQKELNNLLVWEYEILKNNKNEIMKVIINKIYDGGTENTTLQNILLQNSKWKIEEELRQVPIFEVKATQEFPLEETLVPIMKRKLLAYLFQVITSLKEKNI